jgi:WD40 repeat protein
MPNEPMTTLAAPLPPNSCKWPVSVILALAGFSIPFHARAAEGRGDLGKQNSNQIADFHGVSPDFKTIATWKSGKLSVIEFGTGKDRVSITWDKDWPAPYSATFGGDRVALASINSVKIFSMKDGELTHNHRGFIDRASLCEDGQHLLIVESKDRTCHLRIHDLDNKDDAKQLLIGENGRALLNVSGDFAATQAQPDEVCVVKISAGRIQHKISGSVVTGQKQLLPQCIAVSSDGKMLAMGVDDKVKLFDLRTKKITRTLEGHLDVVTSLTFHPDRGIVASSGRDKTIRFWSVKTGKEIHKIKNLSLIPTELRISSDGRKIAYSIGTSGPLEGRQHQAEIATVDSLEPEK